MKRKALLMGMAVMTTLPVSVHAKGPGKPDRESHPYSGTWGSTETIRLEAGREDDAATPKAAALLSYLKTVLAGASYRANAQQEFEPKGWKVELMEPGAGMGLATDPRLEKDLRLGFSFRYTF